MIQWLELLAVGLYVFERTGSAFLVALMGVLRFLPFALFGPHAAVIASRIDRRRTLIGALALMVPISVALGLLVGSGQVDVWHIGLATFFSGSIWALEFPARRTLLGEIVGVERVGTAMALDAMAANGSRMLGPVFGGLLLELIGLEGAYFLSASLYAIAAAAMVWLPQQASTMGRGATSVLRSLVESFSLLRTHRALVGIFAVTIVFNVWGFPFVSMIPVIGQDTLGLSAFPVGLLASAEGAGAFVGAIAVALWARVPHFRRLYFFGVGVYLATILGFGCSQWPALSGLILITIGLAGAAFGAMQSALVFLNAPPTHRAQMMGLLTVCIGTAPIGFLHVGVLAGWLGAPLAVIIIALEGLAMMALCWWRWPELRAFQTLGQERT